MPNIERLQHLRTIIQNTSSDKFDLSNWKCDTTACAAGWAALNQEFNDQGLHLVQLQHYSISGLHFSFEPYFNQSYGFFALEKFFDLDEDTTHELFGNLDVDEYHEIRNSETLTERDIFLRRLDTLLATLKENTDED